MPLVYIDAGGVRDVTGKMKKIFENVQTHGSLGISCRKSGRAQFFYELFGSALFIIRVGRFVHLKVAL